MVVIQVVQTAFVELIAQVFMTLRVYALSRQNKYIRGALSVHVVAQFGLGLYLSVFSGHGLQPHPPVPSRPNCPRVSRSFATPTDSSRGFLL